jgi:hypothetical protein
MLVCHYKVFHSPDWETFVPPESAGVWVLLNGLALLRLPPKRSNVTGNPEIPKLGYPPVVDHFESIRKCGSGIPAHIFA